MTTPHYPDERARTAAGSDAAFVGRGDELRLLDEILAAAARGLPQFVLVEGAAGIGKSALVEQFLSTHGDVAQLRARADGSESELALGVVGQLAAQARPDRRLTLPQSAASELDVLSAGAELLALFGTLQAEGAMLVVALDDVHLADGPSSAALVFACRRLLSDRVVVLATTRPGQAEDAWERLVNGQGGHRITLEGLSPAELTALAMALGTPLTDAQARHLETQTDGHPLYAKTLLASGHHLNSPVVDAATPPAPPPRLSELVTSALANCSPATRALVEAAAILGRACRLSELAAFSEVDDVAAALDEAGGAGLLVGPQDGSLEIRFPHALVHGACYQDMDLTRRVDLHTRAAGLVSGVRRLQHRLAATTGADPELADDLERAAKDERASGDLLGAAEHLHQSAAVTPPGPVAERRLLEATETWLIAGQARQALGLEDVVRACERTPFREHVIGYLALVAGRLPDAEASFRRAWAAIEAAGSTSPENLRGRIAVCMATLTVIDLNTDELAFWGGQALANTAADPQSAPFGWFCMALCLGTLGRGADALKLLNGVAVPKSADVDAARGLVEMWTDDLPAAHAHLSTAFARSRAGESVRVTQALGFLAECEHRMGRFDEASLHAELAVDAATEAGRVWDLPLLHALAAYPAATRGDLDVAESHVRTASEWSALAPIATFRAYAAAAAATLALARDDRDALLFAAQALDATYQLADPGTASFGPILAEALCRVGRFEAAEESLARFETRAAALERRCALVGARRVRGTLEAHRNNFAAAEDAFTDGLRLAANLGVPLETARLEEAYGHYLAARGRRHEARARVDSARVAFEKIGARPYAAAARRTLARLGGPTSPRETRGGSARARPALHSIELSAAEAVVARLVGTGRTNKEIAAELVVSVKAVEYHLTNIYRRLGVSSRVKLAQLMASVDD